MKSKDQPMAFVVFGATGDLTQNKLYPALYELARRKFLPKDFTLYGIARKKMSAEQYKRDISQDISRYAGNRLDKQSLNRLLKKVIYLPADLRKRDAFDQLEAHIKKHGNKHQQAVIRIFYLALPPSLFSDVISNVETCRVGKALCSIQNVHSRIIVEKPFGYDLKTAIKLDKLVRSSFDERQIYRIDHYLGKKAFQTLFAFRFANAYFEGQWNREHIESIQIDALETVGAEGRFSYYDGAGAIRDMVQSHLLQFLAYLTMDEPTELSGKALRKSKENLLAKVTPSFGVNMIRGQYNGYLSEKGVASGSKTETYAALKFNINTRRWKGVPVYIRTGKALSRKLTCAIITFKQSSRLFGKNSAVPNRLQIQIAPSPSITIQMNVDKAGFNLDTEVATMHFCDVKRKDGFKIGDYERLLLDIFKGEQFLFAGSKEVLYSWRSVDTFFKKMEVQKNFRYKKGTEGPKQSEQLFDKKKESWFKMITECPFH